MEPFEIVLQLVQWLAVAAGVVGVTIIAIGGLIAVVRLVTGLFSKHTDGERIARRHIDPIRVEFGRFINLGLEFLIARDLLQTVFTQDFTQLGELLLLVVIRTIISYFLLYEIQKLEDRGVSLIHHKS